jgi:hypothetical protein
MIKKSLNFLTFLTMINFTKNEIIKVPFNIPSDIIEEILFFIQVDDIKTLYSCLLLNRQWCQLVVPILWKHPFYYAQKGNSKLISTILSFSSTDYNDNNNDDDNDKINLIHNNLSLNNRSCTFDYISMIKHLHYDFMIISIEEWYKNNNFNNIINLNNNNNHHYNNNNNHNNKNHNHNYNYNISLIIKYLLRLFMKKSVKLNSLFILPNHVCWNNYNLNRYMELVDPEFNELIKNLKFLYLEIYSLYPTNKFLQKFSLIVNNLVSFNIYISVLYITIFFSFF